MVFASPGLSHSPMCISPTYKRKVSLSGGRGYLGGLHATYCDLQIISATFRNYREVSLVASDLSLRNKEVEWFQPE
jgi:hypothetical protein